MPLWQNISSACFRTINVLKTEEMTLLGNEKSFGQVASNNDDLSQICHILFFISFQIQRMTKITRNMSNNVVNVLMFQPKRFLIRCCEMDWNTSVMIRCCYGVGGIRALLLVIQHIKLVL